MSQELEALIREEIAAGGPMPFARFMELALYHPAWGYYEQVPRAIGRAGDFYTSVSVGPLFGELLGFQFGEWLEALGAGPLQLIEAGAHEGRLAGDVLGWMRAHRGGLFRRTEYWILEPSGRRQAAQQATLGEFGDRVRWFGDWSELPTGGGRGVIFANELLDAMPVHRLGWDALRQRWFEWGVGAEGERFGWVRLPGDAERTARLARSVVTIPPELRAVLPDGFTIEACPAAIAWWQKAAHALQAGRLAALDYGAEAEELLSPARAQGTVRAYRQHSIRTAVLEDAGEQDLTAHVNFSLLRAAGEQAGLATERCEPQGAFFTRLAGETMRDPGRFGTWSSVRRRHLQTLVHPDHLGRALRILVQSRPDAALAARPVLAAATIV